MFGSATNTSFGGSFGAPASSAVATGTSTTPSLFGASAIPTSTSGSSLLGNTATSTATSTPSLFGSTTTASTGSGLFGTTQITTTTPSLFGQSTTTTISTPATTATTTIPTNSLFGGSFSSTTNNTSSLFPNNTTNTQQQQQQQQQKNQTNYLDLNTCFPDTKVPHFVVTPHSVTRSTVPANFFQPSKSRDAITLSSSTSGVKSESKSRGTVSNSIAYNERNATLPFYLTSSDGGSSTTNNNKSSINSFTTKKRVLEDGDTKDTGRNVLLKSEHGVFTRKDNHISGFDKNLSKQGDKLPPVNSLRDVGIPSSVSQQQEQLYEDMLSYKSNYTQSNTQSLSSNLKTKVRVFGYSQDNIELIIKHFTSIGELSEPYVSQGNWITFNYLKPEHAKKAIACNGMNINENHLIGVTYDERAEEVENLQYQQTHDLFTKNDGFMNIFYNNQSQQEKLKKHQENSKESNFIDKLREKLLGW